MNFARAFETIIPRQILRRIFVLCWFLSTLFLLSGCLGTRYLKEGEKLLVKQQIEAPKTIDKEELGELYVQEPNSRIPIIRVAPYVGLYYYGKRRYDEEAYRQQLEEVKTKWNKKIAEAGEDQKKIERYTRKKQKQTDKIQQKIDDGNIWMRWGEPLVIYDSSSIRTTIQRFNLYLQTHGYFKADVDTTLDVGKDEVSVTYVVSPGPAYVLDSLSVLTDNPEISRIIRQHQGSSLLKKGDNYNQSNLTRERERLDLLLKNYGYFAFSRQYIDFDVDTSFTAPQQVAVITNINKPANRAFHKQFRVDSVNFVTNTNQGMLALNDTPPENYNGVEYIFVKNHYNKKVLDRRIFIEKDSLYSRKATFDTQRQLANLDVFRFININYDSTGGKLVANVFTSPLNKYQLTSELGINVTQGFPGPFVNLSLKRRNVFGGMEVFEISGRGGFEGVAPATGLGDVYTSIEAGLNASLTFPQFILPLSDRSKRKLGNINPKTRLSAGYNYTDRPEYRRKNINGALTYSWQNQTNASYQFTLTDLSIIESDLEPSFRQTLDSLKAEGNNIINAFNQSVVSSMYFTGAWNNNSYGLNFTNSSFFRLFLESGGTTLNLVNTGFLERDSLEYYKYIKANLDYRRIHPISKNSTFAWRINLGVARPYASNGILPYEKYFFAGGSNGIRAWRPRRLGPGSYVRVVSNAEDEQVVNYDFEQPGTILLEGSLEYRQDLIGFIDYAFFVDFGNVWLFKDPRPEANFAFNRFYKEIAVGAGLGIRFDFSFLILRLDAGVKIYDPARPEGHRFVLSYYEPPFTRKATETLIFNIGIGYPF